MSEATYALLALGRVRSPWMTELSKWSTAGVIPATVTKCLTAAELRGRLDALRAWSALVIDETLLTTARDVAAIATERGITVISVGTTGGALLREEFTPSDLLARLSEQAVPLPSVVATHHEEVTRLTRFTGRLISVTGAGGTGTSTIAMAVAQAFGTAAIDPGLTLLADFTRNHQLDALCGVTDAEASVEDVVHAHRGGGRGVDVTPFTHELAERGHSLLPGIQKRSAWTSMTPAAIERAVDGLRHAFHDVVVDIDADFEGEAESGSVDVEERNGLSRVAASRSTAVIVVGLPSTKGMLSLVQTITALLDHGVGAERILPLLNHAPKSPAQRAVLSRTVGELLRNDERAASLASPIFTPKARIDAAVRDRSPLPTSFVKSLRDRVDSHCARLHVASEAEPVAITPGTLGLSSEAGA